MGVPVVFLDPRSKGAESYKAFAWEFMAKNPTRFAMPKPESVKPESVKLESANPEIAEGESAEGEGESVVEPAGE
jgi:hypothetical protein